VSDTSLLVPRLVALALAIVLVGVVACYFLVWDKYPKWSFPRLSAWLILFCSVVGLPLLQLNAFCSLSGHRRVDDRLTIAIVLVECALGTALGVWFTYRKRQT